MADPMPTIDTSPGALERLAEELKTCSREPSKWGAWMNCSARAYYVLHAIAAEKRAGPGDAEREELAKWCEDELVDADAKVFRRIATLLRQSADTAAAFLTGAKAMQEAAATECDDLHRLYYMSADVDAGGAAYEAAAAIRAIDPAALTERPVAPVVADGWNYDMSAAPSDESVIISTTGGWIGEAMLIWCGEVWSWCWAGTLQPLHHNHKPTAWHHLPAPPAKQEQTK